MIWTETNRNGQRGTETVREGQRQTQMGRVGQRWTKADKNGQRHTEKVRETDTDGPRTGQRLTVTDIDCDIDRHRL